MNFRNFVNEPSVDRGAGGGGGRPLDVFSLARQSSIYSLTFDEFQNTMGGIGKDFGSMNMDELLKNIWSAEETQTMGSTSGVVPVGQQGNAFGNYLQRQGSLTLPRTLSQKTVDEVWKDVSREYNGGSGSGGSNLPPRQPTLGEVTLEEFLFKAGVVRDETELPEKPNNFDLLGDLTRPVSNQPLGLGFQQMGQKTSVTGHRVLESNTQTSMMANRVLERDIQPVLMGNRVLDSNQQSALQSGNSPLHINGSRSTQQPQQIFPKQPALAYGKPATLTSNTQIGGAANRNSILGITDPTLNGNLVQSAGVGMMGMRGNGVTVAAGSPTISSDGMEKNNGDTSSVSPVPYVFTGGLRGRRTNNAVEKVIERRQRRMIKNRESAARSRARKQAYTMELEAEVAKLKEENQKLRKKQAEIVKMRKEQVLDMMESQQGGKRRRLQRTQSSPWPL